MPKILLVDDERTTTDLLRILLEMDNFEVVVVARGADVIPMAERVAPDIVLMDFHLTDIHGVEILKQIRVHPTLAHLPVVIGSGMNVEQEVMRAGANHFLIKPYEPSDLAPLFYRLIGS